MHNQVAEEQRCKITKLGHRDREPSAQEDMQQRDTASIYNDKYRKRKKLPFCITRKMLAEMTNNQSIVNDALYEMHRAQTRLLDTQGKYKPGDHVADISELEDAYRNLASTITRATIPLLMVAQDIHKETFLWRSVEQEG